MMRITKFMTALVLTVVWILISGSYSLGNIILGLIISYLILHSFKDMYTFTDTPWQLIKKIPKKIKYVFILFWEIIKANFYVLYKILQPKLDIKPGIIAYPFDTTNGISTVMLANTITLTPGTFIIDVHVKDKRLKGPGIYYIHSIYVSSPKEVRDSIKQTLEKYVEEAFG
ncbi:MAG: Na+/H+ antiporter subunit E [Methanosarcinaceae archaeon]|nr:Na+/H+ antiporter subunit E [Methanosarcinaceae archaeon]